MREYVLGFLFDNDLNSVCLIRKNRPEWQAGLLNGVGGKIEPYEQPVMAMVREFEEEAGVKTTPNKWHYTLTLRFPYANIHVFCAANTKIFYKAKTTESEAICKILLSDISNFIAINNVPSLINLCVLRLKDVEGVA